MENHAEPPGGARSPGKRQPAAPFVTASPLNRDLLYYAIRYDGAGGAPIILRFALPIETVDEVVQSFRRSLWLSSLLILLIAGAAALQISRMFSDRVERLKEFSRRVAAGDFRPIPADSSGDALEALGASMNRTAAQLDDTIRTLTEERNLSTAILGQHGGGRRGGECFGAPAFRQPGLRGNSRTASCRLKSGSALVEIVRQTELIEAVRRVLHGESRVEAEIATGTLRQHFFAATVASVRAGDTLGAVVVLHDISELRRLERVRRDFVANVSHEFKTPLTAIQGFAETLLAGAHRRRAKSRTLPRNYSGALPPPGAFDRRSAAPFADGFRPAGTGNRRIQRGANRGQLPGDRAASRRWKTAIASLRQRVPCEMPNVAGDRRRLAEVLQNLLDNARQYTLPGGEIVLSAEAHESKWSSPFPTPASGSRRRISRGFSNGSTAWMRRVREKPAEPAWAWRSPSI